MEMVFGDESLIQKFAPKFKFATNEGSVKKRILFVTNKLFKETVHVIKNNGFIRCIAQDGEVCPACNFVSPDPKDTTRFQKPRYATHILEYATDSNGAVLNPFSYQIKIFPFAKKTAEKIQSLHENMGEMFSKLDIIVACESPTYQTLSFTPVLAGNCSEFSKQPDALKTQMRADIAKKISELPLVKEISDHVTAQVMSDMLSGKIKKFADRVEANATAAVSAPAATAAQAALPLTVASVTTTAAASTVVVEATPVQKDASKMMDELSI